MWLLKRPNNDNDDKNYEQRNAHCVIIFIKLIMWGFDTSSDIMPSTQSHSAAKDTYHFSHNNNEEEPVNLRSEMSVKPRETNLSFAPSSWLKLNTCHVPWNMSRESYPFISNGFEMRNQIMAWDFVVIFLQHEYRFHVCVSIHFMMPGDAHTNAATLSCAKTEQ